MLPAALLSVDPAGTGAYAPRYLTKGDEAWVARAASAHAALVGLAQARVDAAWSEEIAPSLDADGAPARAVAGVRRVLGAFFQTEVRAAIAPARIREVVFEEAARGGRRDEVLDRAASALRVRKIDLEEGLFADRLVERVLCPRREAFTAPRLIHAYNLALVQGLLFRAVRVRVDVSELTHAVVRHVKVHGLLAAYAVTDAVSDGGAFIDVSGPLALFRNTLKYGRALAAFFPTLAGIPGYRLEASCSLESGARQVVVAAGDPLPSPTATRVVDTAVERALVRDVRRIGGAWSIARETTVVRAGRGLVFPDFALTSGNAKILVEIVGYHTRDFIERKMAALDAANVGNVIVCVDANLDCDEHAVGGAAVVAYRRRIDAATLLETAARMARTPSPASR